MATADLKDQENFRDSISTVGEDGKRIWVYPKKPKGDWTNKRTYVSYVLLVLLISGPFIRVGGMPLLKFNFLEREFIIFGQLFSPYDFHIFAILMITGVVFVVLFTVAFGRLFCGWVCPQTIFMEMVFRKVEYWIEGDWTHQKKLDKMPWNKEKIKKKTLKHTIFFLMSFVISNVFLAYIIGSEALIKIITEPVSEHLGGLVSIIIFAGVFYVVFAKLREQVCTSICPYGRLQGVMLDKNSVLVIYDDKRGENRSKFKKTEDRAEAGKGDCIDCNQCVNVCPTGIDIRNGTQMECINCTACIDACNSIMQSIKKPEGLIRYATENEVEKGEVFQWTGRLKAYAAVLALLFVFLTSLVVTRDEVSMVVMKPQGTIFQKLDDGRVSNIFNIKLINKSNALQTFDLKIEGKTAEIEWAADQTVLEIEPFGTFEGMMFVKLDPTELEKTYEEIDIGIYRNGERVKVLSTTFQGPLK